MAIIQKLLSFILPQRLLNLFDPAALLFRESPVELSPRKSIASGTIVHVSPPLLLSRASTRACPEITGR